MSKKLAYTTNSPSSTTDYVAADGTWKSIPGGSGGGVPYTGATSNVDLGEYELKAGQIEFDQSPTGTAGVAVMRWNDTDGTLDLGMKGGNVTLQIGQEQLTRVVNKVGSNLLEANYQAVRITGAQGNRLKVDLAQANNDANSAQTLGIVTETINDNQEGFITTSGLVRGIDTTGTLQSETWADGDMLYLSGAVAGRLTNVKPSAPTHTIIMGYVVRAHGTQGQIYVKVDNGYELEELHNVSITSPTNGQILTYNSVSGLWVNSAPATQSSVSFQTIVGSATGLAAGVTRYGNVAGTTAESQNRVPISVACTMSDLYVRTTATMNASASLAVTLFKNGSSTALTLTIAGGSAAGTYSNTANSVTFAAGDGFNMEYKNVGSAAAAASSGTGYKITI